MSVHSSPATRPHERVLDGYNFLLAAFLASTPWLFAYSQETTRIDMWITGGAMATIALLAIAAYAVWYEWANIALGIWLIASPWVIGFTHTRAMHFAIGIGLAVVYMAGIQLMLGSKAIQEAKSPHGNDTAG